MTIASGVGARYLFAEHNFSGNAGAMTRMGMEVGQQNTTTLQDEAMRRTATVRAGFLDWMAYFDDDADSGTGPHDILAAMSTANREASYLHRATRGAPAWSMTTRQVSHAHQVANGELTVNIATVANGTGLEMGEALTAGVENSTGTEALAGVDNGAATSFGLQAYLHVISFTGTSVDITLQESSDDASGDPYADVTGGAFTTVTGVGSERIATARDQAVEQWLRVDLDGTYTDLDFVVVVVRNLAQVLF